MNSYEMPRFIDNPLQVFWLEVDEIFPMFLCFGVGLVLRKALETSTPVTLGLVFGILASWLYRRHKRGALSGALLHILHTWGVIALNKRFSNGLLREFTN